MHSIAYLWVNFSALAGAKGTVGSLSARCLQRDKKTSCWVRTNGSIVKRYLSRNSRLEGQYGFEEEVDPLDLDGTCSPPAPAAAGTAPKATSYPCYSFSRRRRLGFTRLRREIWLRRTQRPQRWRKPCAALRSCCEYSVTQVFFFLFIGHSRRAAMCYLGFALPIKAILYLLAGREEIISPYEKPTSPNQICSIALFSAK
jgi:hypothetical protein